MNANSKQGINVTSILRKSLISSIILLCVTCIFSITYLPENVIHELFNASDFPSGKWPEDLEDYVFRYSPLIKMEIIEDNNNAKYLSTVLEKGEMYKGFGITSRIDVPKHSELIVEWRYLGQTESIQIDLVDIDEEKKAGETFSIFRMPLQGQWTESKLPLQEFKRNEYQSPNSPNDGILNTHAIQNLEFLLPPDAEATVDIRKVCFTSISPKWVIITILTLVIMIGILLLVRTSREFYLLEWSGNDYSNTLSIRVMYLLMSVSFIHTVLNYYHYQYWLIPLVMISIFYAFLVLNEFVTSKKFQELMFCCSFIFLFAAGWWLEFPSTPIDMFLYLLVTAIPIIQHKRNIIIYLSVVVLILLLPLIVYRQLHMDIAAVVYTYSFFVLMLVSFLGIHMNMLTKMQAQNTFNMYEDLFNSTSDAIFSMDIHGRIDNANPGFAKLIGKKIEGLIGSNISDLVVVDDQNLLPENQQNQNESLREYDLRFVNQEGGVVNANIVERSKREQDAIAGYQFIARDMTKWKEIEKLQKEKEIVERTSALKSSFLANMTHEIRTPLFGVMGTLDVIEGMKPTEEQKEYLSIAKSSGKMLLDLVNNILDFAKIESGKTQLEHIEFNLFNLVRDISDIVREQTEKKQLEYDVYLPKDNSELYLGDPLRIRQVLLNLVGNAMKFTEKGKVSLYVFLKKDKKTYTRFRFEVIDTGIGIEKEKVADIFNVFTQEDNSTTREYGGTGLGLAISKELVHLMGGEIGVETEKGQGSKFWFEITLQKETAGIPQLVKH